MIPKEIVGRIARISAIVLTVFGGLLFGVLQTLLLPYSLSSHIFHFPQSMGSLAMGYFFIFAAYKLIKNHRSVFLLLTIILSLIFVWGLVKDVFPVVTSNASLPKYFLLNEVIYLIMPVLVFISWKFEQPLIVTSTDPQASQQPITGVQLTPNITQLSQQPVEQVTQGILSQLPSESFTPLQYQGVVVRGFAQAIDQIVVGAPLFLLFAFLSGSINSSLVKESGRILYPSLLFLLYCICAEALYGQTLGKKIFGIKVKMTDGRRVTWKGAIIRNIGRILDTVVGNYLLGVLCIVLTRKKQRVGDMLAGTVVVRDY